jgi:hypothetical protein
MFDINSIITKKSIKVFDNVEDVQDYVLNKVDYLVFKDVTNDKFIVISDINLPG